MLERQLEPELMDDHREALLYDEMDHSEVNRVFVCDLLQSGEVGIDIVDLGTGTARIPIELCRQRANCRVMASDAAVSMLEIARLNVAVQGFEHRIQLHHGDSKKLGFCEDMFDAVISNSLVHHLPDPESAIAEMIRIVKPGGRIFVRDLFRPESLEETESLVQTHVGNEPPSAQQLFRQSLLAALTLDEIRAMVSKFDFPAESVERTSDRHWTWSASKSQSG